MKFDQIILSGTQSITLFDLNNPRSTPYTARGFDGLDPTDVDVTLAQTSGGNGIYIGRREQLREITGNVYLNPDYSIGQTPDTLREALYLLNPVNADQSLDFRLMLEGVEVAYTPVYIKRTEAAPFSKDTILQLTLASTSGTFRRRTSIAVSNPTFDKVNPVMNNAGSAPTGFRLQVEFLAAATKFGLRQFNPTFELVMEKLASDPDLFLTGDHLVIDTNIGTRGVWRTRASVTTSVMANLTDGSTWLSLYPGDNTLEALLLPATHASTINWKLYTHTPRYRGV